MYVAQRSPFDLPVGGIDVRFRASNETTKIAPELYDNMLELYPNRTNLGSLRSSAAAAKALS